MIAHAQKPDFVFRRNGIVHLNRRGRQFSRLLALRPAVHISLQGMYCLCKPVFCSHVTLTGYPLHSVVSPSVLHPCVTVCHHISNADYLWTKRTYIEASNHIMYCGLKKTSSFSVLFITHLSWVLRNKACSIYVINCRILVRHTKQRATCLLLTKRLHVGWLEYA
jgi:hypothetical protein